MLLATQPLGTIEPEKGPVAERALRVELETWNLCQLAPSTNRAVGLAMGLSHSQFFGAFCLAVRTLTFCKLMGFPLNH